MTETQAHRSEHAHDALQRMRLAGREMHVTRGASQTAARSMLPHPWWGIGARAARLAEAVRARYTPRLGCTPPAGLIYPSSHPLLALQITYRRPLTLALRMALTLLQWPGIPTARPGGSAAGAAGPGSGGVAVRTHSLPQRLLRPAGFEPRGPGRQASPGAAAGQAGMDVIAHARPVGSDRAMLAPGGARLILSCAPLALQKLARRGERVPMVRGERPGAFAAAVEASAPPVPRTVRRSGPDESDLARAAQQGIQPLPSAEGQPPAWPATSGSIELDRLDASQVGRLADRVVQVIDNRIIARRERMGRI